MRVGCLINMNSNPYECIRHFSEDLGFKSGQLSVWDMSLYTDENAEAVKKACLDFGFTVSAVWCGWEGPHEWKYPGMYETIGFVPADWRAIRVKNVLAGASFAKAIGVKDIVTHAGYMSDNPTSPDRMGVLYAVRYICREIAKDGQRFLFETGEELPNSLVQLIKEIGCDNIGINYDPANMMINGRANSYDALCMFAPYVCGFHGKDAVYPKDGNPKGKEVMVGKGGANYPKLIEKLTEIGYDGYITIEREIPDSPERDAEIAATKVFLEDLIEKAAK